MYSDVLFISYGNLRRDNFYLQYYLVWELTLAPLLHSILPNNNVKKMCNYNIIIIYTIIIILYQ